MVHYMGKGIGQRGFSNIIFIAILCLGFTKTRLILPKKKKKTENININRTVCIYIYFFFNLVYEKQSICLLFFM